MPPPSAPTLPGYVTIRDILDGKIAKGSLVNVFGVVLDFRDAIETRSTGENLSITTVN
jgi:hypothetical protein